jgi:spore maturation protein B
VFLEGAKDGMEISIKIVPSIVGIMVAVAVFRESGAMDLLIKLISPIISLFGIPNEVAPVALMRPVSGSASLGILSQVISQHGPDSLVGKIACCIMGCTETTFYTLALYFGSVKIKNIKNTMWIALLADAAAIIVVCWLVR